MKQIFFTDIAKACYYALAALKSTTGNANGKIIDWSDQTDEYRNDFVAIVSTHYNRCASGNNDPAMVHKHWCNIMLNKGWIGGPIFSEEEKTNPAITPWISLPDEHKVKNHIIAGICNALFISTNSSTEVYVFQDEPVKEQEEVQSAPADE